MAATAQARQQLPNVLLNVDIVRKEPEVARARSEVAEALTLHALDALVETARLLTSELVTNAVMHGSGDIVTVILRYAGDELTISVTDNATDDLPDPRLADSDSENGRGMLLVRALGVRWGVTVDHLADVKHTWVCLPVHEWPV